MFLVNKRQSETIEILTQTNHAIKIKELAERFHVSSRTVQYDIDCVRNFLREYNIQITYSRRTGYQIVDKKTENIQKVYRAIHEMEDISAEERKNVAILKLLEGLTCTYSSLADSLRVSRQTVINNFDKIEQKVKDLNLAIKKEKGVGILLVGDEINFRFAFNHLILNNKLTQEILNCTEFCCNKSNITIAKQIINHAENSMKIRFFETAVLEMEICYGLYRISKGKQLNEEIDVYKEEGSIDEFPMFKSFYKTLDLMQLSHYEKRYIVSLLMSTKIKYSDSSLDVSTEAKSIATFLAEKLEILHPLKSEEREKFMEGLMAHLGVAVYRTKNHIPIKNDLLNQIRITIPLIFEYTKVQMMECGRMYGDYFDDHEIAYIAMYVASAYESSLKVRLTVNILVVCSYSNTTCSILYSRLKQNLPDCNLWGPISKEEFKAKQTNEVDLILTAGGTVDTDIPQINVNPLIYVDDLDKIQSRVYQLSYAKLCKEFLSEFKATRDDRHISIKNLIREDHIQIVESCNHWQEAVQIAAEPLLRDHLIEERYVERVIQEVSQLGTYMVIVPEFAFVHAGAKDGVINDCMSLLILKKPLVFGDHEQKIVKSIVLFGINDKNATPLLDLVDILLNGSNIRILTSEEITKDIILNLHSK